MAKKRKKKRKDRRSRLKTARDKQLQLKEIEKAQKRSRQQENKVIIDSIEKSRRRFENSLRNIRNAEDAIREFE